MVAYSAQVNNYVLWTYEIGGRQTVRWTGRKGRPTHSGHRTADPSGSSLTANSRGSICQEDKFRCCAMHPTGAAARGIGTEWSCLLLIHSEDCPASLLREASPVEITKPDTSRFETSHRWPVFLPDGRHFIYLAANFSRAVRDITPTSWARWIRRKDDAG